jgi:hypothetical protein
MTTKQTNQEPTPIPEHIRSWMLQLGYVHDMEVEEATSTVILTWSGPDGPLS